MYWRGGAPNLGDEVIAYVRLQFDRGALRDFY